jgi:hypothetical protein
MHPLKKRTKKKYQQNNAKRSVAQTISESTGLDERSANVLSKQLAESLQSGFISNSNPLVMPSNKKRDREVFLFYFCD